MAVDLRKRAWVIIDEQGDGLYEADLRIAGPALKITAESVTLSIAQAHGGKTGIDYTALCPNLIGQVVTHPIRKATLWHCA